MTEIGQITF